MAKQVINRGASAGDAGAETLYAAFGKAIANFDELYGGLAGVTLLDKTAAYAVQQADAGRLIRGDASGGAFAFTLPASGAATGDVMRFRKSDTSANRVTVKDNGGSDVAWLSAQRDQALFFWSGSAWVPLQWNIQPLRQVFASSGTSTRPPLATSFDAILIGGGGGGGGGRVSSSSANRAGGAGGAGGAAIYQSFLAGAHGATESVTIGAGGSGGAGVTTGSGANGGAGGTTSLGALVKADPGAGGAGGGSSAAASAVAPATGTFGQSGAGGATSTSAASSAGGDGVVGGGGGGGSA
ncbi:hypothetical protein, partial [Sphingomonas sp.]|uniref:hypothetical protein n=1 Tax=Sphingomonas sp. TaxID=28214 RepID=UPI001B1C722B